MMSEIKVYIGCYKNDFYLLRSCIASIRYWNKTVPVVLLKDFSKGAFDTTELERIFDVTVAITTYKTLGGYMKLQPYIEHPDERIFLQDADMVWLGDMMQVLNGIKEDIAIHAYTPDDVAAELSKWYFEPQKLKQYYPNYKYPGFVFNGGSILLHTKVFNQNDFDGIIAWQERATPLHAGTFLCEDQGIINYLVADKYFKGSCSIAKVCLQVSAESSMAVAYSIADIKKQIQKNIIVHWLGNKTGLTTFYASRHLLRFFEKQYYRQIEYGTLKMWAERLLRTTRHMDKFMYGLAKKIYYYLFIKNGPIK